MKNSIRDIFVPVLLCSMTIVHGQTRIEEIRDDRDVVGYSEEYAKKQSLKWNGVSMDIYEVFSPRSFKEVEDYGMHGTYGLSLLYKYFRKIQSQSLPRKHGTE